MRRVVMVTAAVLAFAAARGVADDTWTGQVSDSMCGARHESGAEGQPAPSAHDCTLACVKGGSKFVLVATGRVFQIANQDHPSLGRYAGVTVRVTGSIDGDRITVRNIEEVAP